ncbi:MAG: hypothetical protein KF861_21730 [Planctomycetaceae bacterium]|nr:hypothetical protein [Planctomycetaceae bacterium]
MKQETLIWTLIMLAGGTALLARAVIVGNGRVYVHETSNAVAGTDVVLTESTTVPPRDRNEAGVRLSWSRTIGTWVAALCTLGILSFLLGDNPLYKLTEAVVVGVSAAYLMVVGFWSEVVQNLFGNLIPGLMERTLLPGLPDVEPKFIYLIPLVMGGMMLWRLSPIGGNWIARWPLAFFIGATAGVRLVASLESDFVQQINSTILPLVVFAADGSFLFWQSLKNVIISAGVLMGLTYFFFSVEHRGIVGGLARGGVWLLMITFGALFGYTVMGRVALLTGRLEFLFDDWLWLIDPTASRVGM